MITTRTVQTQYAQAALLCSGTRTTKTLSRPVRRPRFPSSSGSVGKQLGGRRLRTNLPKRPSRPSPATSLFVSFQAVFPLDQQVAVINPDPRGPWGGRRAGRRASVRVRFLGFILFPLGVAEVRGQTLLAVHPLVLEDRVDVVHLAQPLEEWDEVQQLRVGHVVEPRGHGNLRRKVGKKQTNKKKQKIQKRWKKTEEKQLCASQRAGCSRRCPGGRRRRRASCPR